MKFSIRWDCARSLREIQFLSIMFLLELKPVLREPPVGCCIPQTRPTRAVEPGRFLGSFVGRGVALILIS
jgi:hypothetical protein